MKKIFLTSLTMLIALIFSCNTDTDNTNNSLTKYLGVIRGGCADGLLPEGVILDEKPDTLFHFISGDTLTIFVGFNAPCCLFYEDKAKIEDDNIEMLLVLMNDAPCYCMCYYEFNFKFIGFEKKEYSYNVTVDGTSKFTGKIDLR
ncbi:MAG: hypothetical protein V1779_01680 [bacterium]